ncbi:outer membrane beta-barrel protein [Algoriphagus boritolerans]|uniref:outer membrane beta-barrel protein n=1 Tax=Algoriphagus boritolerans TaxID=308111 RepID=UPI000AF87586
MHQRLLFILPLLLLSFGSFAQFEKGNKLLGGTLNYSSSTFNPGLPGQISKTNSLNISPILGVFVSDRTLVGLVFDALSYNSENSYNGQESSYESNRFGFGPFVRRYFPVREWVAFYGQADLGYSAGKTKQTYSNSPNQNYERSLNVFHIGTSLGLAFFPTNWMSIDLSMNPLSFSHTVDKNEVGSSFADQRINSFNFNLSTDAFFYWGALFLE